MMIKRKLSLFTVLFLLICLCLTGCGGSAGSEDAGDTVYSEAGTDTYADSSDLEAESDSDSVTADPDAIYINDGSVAGLYMTYEIADYSLSEYADMLGISMRDAAEVIEVELYNDGTARFGAYDVWADVEFSQNGDNVVFEGDGEWVSGSLKEGLLTLDMAGTQVVLARLTDRAFDGSVETDLIDAAKEASESESASDSTGTGASAPAGVPSGDGYVSGEKIFKGYVWLSKVVTNEFDLTYEDIADYFGTDGQFDKEEYSDHMGRNYRYYKWISKDDELDYIYFNFEENDDGSYTLSSYNTNHFSGTEMVEKYLDEVKAEAAEADRAAASSMEMKTITCEIYRWSENTDPVTVTVDIPTSGWSYNEDKDQIVDNEDPSAWGAGFIQFTLDRDLAALDRYKDDFENYKEIGERKIGGITFQGRTYKNIGYEWEEYIAAMPDGRGFSIGIVKLDTSDGTVADKILNSISFK